MPVDNDPERAFRQAAVTAAQSRARARRAARTIKIAPC
jgi:hypothetical protein